MAKHPWRFQGDIAYGESDPMVTVFMGDLETDEDTGDVSVRQDTRNPVTMRLSELKNAAHLASPDEMEKVRVKQRDDRVAAAAAAKVRQGAGK